MSDVDERQERLRTALRAAAEALHNLVDEERTAAGDGVELLEGVLAYVDLIVEQTDGSLITDPALTGIETHANAIAADPNTTATSARTYADVLLTAVAVLPPARERETEQAVKEIVANFQRSATQRLNAVEAEAEKTSAEITAALATLRAEIASASEKSTGEIQTHATAFETKLTELEATLTAQQQRLDTMLERHSEAFTEKQDERAEAFQAEVVKVKADLEAFVQTSKDEVDQHMDEIRRMEEESSGLVHSIGLGGTAERYGEEAKEQKRVANGLRWLTVALALGAVGMAIYAVVHQVEDTSAVLAKLSVSLVLGALATYTASQSGRHRAREERARTLQLELTAFAPFVEPLGADLKELERVLMTRKTFGNIAGLPGGDDDHRFGLGPVLESLKKRIAKRLDEASPDAPDD